jgi:hypothetical protein
MSKQLSQIAMANDLLRTTFITGKVILTKGVSEATDRDDVITAVRTYADFNEDNDPYGEHDWGGFNVNGRRYFFKIDYYDHNFEFWADPTSQSCRRVLTIMHADEY